eukprot:1792398-Heterocapsa_arctica.AAC.1
MSFNTNCLIYDIAYCFPKIVAAFGCVIDRPNLGFVVMHGYRDPYCVWGLVLHEFPFIAGMINMAL